MTELDPIKRVMWNFHVNNSQGNYGCDRMLVHDILSKLNIDFLFSENTIIEIGGVYKGFAAPQKDISKINFNAASNFLKY